MTRQTIVLYLSVALLFCHLTSTILLTNIIIGLLALTVLIDRNIVSKIKAVLLNKQFWIITSLFFMFFISALYSTNHKAAWKLSETRAAMLLFPLIYSLVPLNLKDTSIFLKSFIIMVCIIPVIGVFTQWGKYIETNDSGWFYNDNIVHYVEKQAVYFAMYINIALVAIFYLWHNKKLQKKYEKINSVIAVILLIIFEFLLASRTSMLTTVLLIVGFIGVLSVKKINYKQAFILLSILILFATSLTILFPKVLKRFYSITQVEFQFDNTNPINHYNGEIKKENWNGLNTRLALWTCAIDEIYKQPIFGTGIGDVKDDLIKNYQEKDFIFGIQMGYNCHNQYLDILLSNGLLGLLIFLFVLTSIIIRSIKERNIMLFGVVLIFSIACLTENILNRNQGIILISLMISVFLFGTKKINLYENTI